MRAFSSSWKGSKKPSKQRKYRYGAPLHVRRRFLSVHLTNELKDAGIISGNQKGALQRGAAKANIP